MDFVLCGFNADNIQKFTESAQTPVNSECVLVYAISKANPN